MNTFNDVCCALSADALFCCQPPVGTGRRDQISIYFCALASGSRFVFEKKTSFWTLHKWSERSFVFHEPFLWNRFLFLLFLPLCSKLYWVKLTAFPMDARTKRCQTLFLATYLAALCALSDWSSPFGNTFGESTTQSYQTPNSEPL